MTCVRIPNLQKKSGLWFFVRRVPKRFTSVDHRVTIYITARASTLPDDPVAASARHRAVYLNEPLQQCWTQQSRILEEDIQIDTANKSIGFLRIMLPRSAG